MDTFEQIRQEAKHLFKGSKGSHDWEHTERVLALAMRIAQEEGADLEIVRLAAVLHDIARGEEDHSSGKIDHAVRGAEMAEGILQHHGVPPDTILGITHCIQTHRFRNNLEPLTLEAAVLFDADKLDSIGAVGIGRAFLFAGEVGAKLHNPGADLTKTLPYSEEDTAYREYAVKLSKIKDKIITSAGKRLAAERHAFMTDFFERLNREVAGII